ncbi:MAG: SDR family NAD(P)-dependent oxidoreductase [Clostridia bacterium]|nr:SDR family NAD(P)-dependent oxidoreductase [Clostridia bacterium]
MRASTVAPVIRQRYAREGVAPVVRLLAGEKISGGLRAAGEDALFAALPAAEPARVEVEGVGAFALHRKHRPGRLSGKIVIVTGSAQGFGEGIAAELLGQGCYLAYADLNEAQARRNAEAANRAHGQGAAIAVRCDVGDEASVAAMVDETVAAFGGLDLFVSNAGILISGGLEDLEPASFELVTKVNYTGYFLCAKHAARVMKLQRRFNPEATADIVQINSKSGLEGSNKNFAYAGGKFGGIGLTQSFAKELVEFGIKVNAVCPGNYFEGPLWMDPHKGLFAQYLKAGKAPGARTAEDVKRFYEAKVPMGRGCFPADVARAILYCVEQAYETGQAIPVTGGQNMLK